MAEYTSSWQSAARAAKEDLKIIILTGTRSKIRFIYVILDWAVRGGTGLYLAVMGCTGWYWAVLGCTGRYWAVLGGPGLY